MRTASSSGNMAGSSGTTPGAMTPAVTPAGSTADSEKNIEFQENEKILSQDFLSIDQITDLLKEADIDGIQEKMRVFLNFKNLQTCLRDAILLDYYVSGFFWAKEMDFSLDQYSKFMTLLDMLLHNLQTLHMSLEDSIKWLGEVMAEIGPNRSPKNEELNVFDVKEANAIIDYLKISLFQHYSLYEFMFYSTREEIVIGTAVNIMGTWGSSHQPLLAWDGGAGYKGLMVPFPSPEEGAKQTIEVVKPADHPFPAPLEEGISLDIYSAFIEPLPTPETGRKAQDQEESPQEPQSEREAAEMDPLVGFTIDDVKSALARVTDEVLLNIQNEIKEKLQVQEEAFNARIEKLKKA